MSGGLSWWTVPSCEVGWTNSGTFPEDTKPSTLGEIAQGFDCDTAYSGSQYPGASQAGMCLRCALEPVSMLQCPSVRRAHSR